MSGHYWLSCTKMTVYAEVGEDERIIKTAPITRKFVGQPLHALEHWLAGFGGYVRAELAKTEESH